MFQNNFNKQLALLALVLLLQAAKVISYKRNYEAAYVKANVPLWKQRACEKAQVYKANSHYICDDKGDVKCLPGWQGDLCQVPMCRKGCDPMNGYCQRPGECRCRIGYTGELCDKCIPLPGCQHGDCTKPFECICRPGWDGLFCTEPTCRQGCHNTRGYCETPGECRCRIGWAGRNCSDCSVLPGCQHGTCTKPLECQCLAGYTGLLCQTPICSTECHKQHGYCKRPGECRCKVGWTGINCDKCFPYPGCVNGDCEKPWECNCKPEWGGLLCDEKLTYCQDHSNICENKGKCIPLTKEDGNYRCHCKQGYLGKNCEIVDEFLLTSTAAPRITPPPLVDWSEEDNETNSVALNNEKELENSLSYEKKEQNIEKLSGNHTQEKIATKETMSVNTSQQAKNITLNFNVGNNIENTTGINSTKVLMDLPNKQENVLSNKTVNNFSEPSVIHILSTANTTLEGLTPLNETKILSLKTNISETSVNSTFHNTSTIPSTETKITSSTIIPPLSKLDDEKNLHSIPESNKKPNNNDESDDEDDDDEECTDDNDEDCEYVDEDEEDDDDF